MARAQETATKPPDVTPEAKQQVLQAIGIQLTRAYAPGADFGKWPQFREEQRAAIDKAQTPAEFAAAVNAALARFGVSHVIFRTPQAARARGGLVQTVAEAAQVRAEVIKAEPAVMAAVGIGVRVRGEPGGLRVALVFRGSPADNAGILVGDLIIEVDGKTPDNGALWNTEGKEVSLKVRRADGSVKDFLVKQAQLFPLPADSLLWPASDTAVLKVHTFDLGYDAPRIEAFMRQAASAKYLVLDLRGNPGGKITNLAHLLGMFLKEGTPIGTLVSRPIVDQYVKETGGDPNDTVKIAKWTPNKLTMVKSAVPVFTGHVAVLVDSVSGSTAEMAASALQDILHAPVVGPSKTPGTVLASYIAALPFGYTLQFPVMDYVTLRGVRLEGKGVQPDITTANVPATVGPGPDVATDRAIAELKKAALLGGDYRPRGSRPLLLELRVAGRWPQTGEKFMLVCQG